MAGRYVFELVFKTKRDNGSVKRDNLFVIIDGESMTDFSKLRQDLGKCTPEPFGLQYVDDEDDIVSIDTEEEFKEFAKLARQRSSRGMLIKLILDPNPVDRSRYSQAGLEEAMALPSKTDRVIKKASELYPPELLDDHLSAKDRTISGIELTEWQWKFKEVLKKELLSEIEKGNLSGNKQEPSKEKLNQPSSVLSKGDVDYEEDSDGNMVFLPDKKKLKLLNKQKKLEKKEKLAETKIDQRLERLEWKKKKLIEKAEQKLLSAVYKMPFFDSKIGLPCIRSLVVTKESSIMLQRVLAGKPFCHVWHVVNDGTVTLDNVELRHTWSSAGLEPFELCMKCSPLTAGQEGTIRMGFKAPKEVTAFISYWHFFYQVDSKWQQFGHYVVVQGHTKLPKSTGKITLQDDAKTSKQDKSIYVSLAEDLVQPTTGKAVNETKVLNDETNLQYEMQMEVTKKLEATLASSVIAAEMAREAAKAAIRRAVSSQASACTKTSEMDKLKDCLNEVEVSVKRLNLVDSGSDTDANMDINEDSDPGFVVVDVPSYCSEVPEIPSRTSVNTTSGDKKVNTLNCEESNNIIVCSLIPADTTNVHATSAKGAVDKVILSEENVVETVDHSKLPVESLLCERRERPFSEEYTHVEEPLSFPRMDPNVNYPVFPPHRVNLPYPAPNFLPHQHAPHGYPVFPPQSSSSHAMVFPPPPPMVHFSTPKLNPPVHYSQIPTYPPMTGSSHPMPIPIISPAIPTPPTLQIPPPQMVPPQINPPPVTPQSMMASYPMNPLVPMQVFGVDRGTGRTNSTSSFNGKAKTPLTTIETDGIASAVSSFTPHSTVHSSVGKTQTSTCTTVASSVNQTPTTTFHTTYAQTENKPKPADSNKQQESGVQILPQALVDGAINVAASAYSTAWNALNNLRPKDGVEVEFDPVFENNMAILIEMGFNNVERNARLLKRYNNDVSQVIGVICASGGGDLNLD